MKRKLLTIVASITLCTFFILGACSKESSTTSSNGEKEFRYAMSGLYKPFNYKENDGKLVGFDVEIGEALAKKDEHEGYASYKPMGNANSRSSSEEI